ncbi:glycosyltransferase family 92 protein RCOM_0530710-like isoform X2 [Neltuma alba]|uniref:glycosyltransferase family 92 protein RCOM_0530710-like isoform X2 n=1 Tax=Neltuma alba TaxID=207710 RepID=UPI0010A5490E|nr:glycosyltransferase family 92 protein RCOM_0530710-like isoform X2 [Prosopis alba]
MKMEKRTIKSLWSNCYFFSARSLFVCFSFFIFFFFLIFFDRFSFGFHPNLSPSSLSLFYYSSASYSILDSLNFNQTFLRLPFTLQHRILFPDHLLLIVTGREIPRSHELECVYYKLANLSEEVVNPVLDVLSLPVISTDQYAEFRYIVRCPIPPTNYSYAAVFLRRCGGEGGDRHRSWELLTNQTNHSWNNLAYEAYLDGDTVVVFVKGLNLRPHQISDPTQFRCHFGLKNGEFILKTEAISAAQEVVRCSLPRSIANNPNKAHGFRVTVSRAGQNKRRPIHKLMPSVATIQNRVAETTITKKKKKHDLCVCTMVWNQASALKEWIIYHSWLGVERWFIYDNNSDDDIENIIEELDLEGYNVSRTTWPWIKTQEAGFSHCALRSKQECNWVGFFDVDEFFYLKNRGHHQNGLKLLVSNFSSSSSKLAEIRTACHNFGPSGLTSHPKRGVTTGYTCRMKNAERHKSIVKPEMLDTSLLNVVHHFQLKEGMWSVQVKEGEGVINHYKYQVWERFKDKFLRRVATYVVDWREDKNTRSKDRAPGLGTQAIEPPNWRLRFCEVWDTGLKDFVLSHFADPETGTLPWENSSQVQ